MAIAPAESATIIVLLGNIAVWLKMMADNKKSSSRPSNGNGKPCSAHPSIESRILSIEARKVELGNKLDALHKENREDHQKIFEDIKEISVEVATSAQAAHVAAEAAALAVKNTASARYGRDK